MKKRYGACIALGVLIGAVLGAFAVGTLVVAISDEFEWAWEDGDPRRIYTYEEDAKLSSGGDPATGRRTRLHFPTPGAELSYEDPGWDLVEYAVLLCLAQELAVSGEDEGIARAIDQLGDEAGGGPPEHLQGIHDGLVSELRGLDSLRPSTAQGRAKQAFARANEDPLLEGVMGFPCEVHYETMGQAMQEVIDVIEPGMTLCFAWEEFAWKDEDAFETAFDVLEGDHWPAELRGLRDEMIVALDALPENPPWEMVEAIFQPVQQYPALMFAMPCVLSAGPGGIEFGLEEGRREEALSHYALDVCEAWEIALEGGLDAKYGAIAVLEATTLPYELEEMHEELVEHLELLPDTFTENEVIEVFAGVRAYPLLREALQC